MPTSGCSQQTTKKYTSRPSPPYPANECQGSSKKGNDGRQYTSIANAKGIYQWKLASAETKKTVISKKKKAPVPKGTHRIYFGELYTMDREMMTKFSKKTIGLSNLFKVTDKFYATLLKKPKYVTKKDGNAYIFGPRFPLNQYTCLGEHGNDGAQTGLIDYDLWMKNPEDQGHSDLWSKIYLQKKHFLNWDNRKALMEMRKTFPEILFVGYTFGGDVGASLWAHYDKSGAIDSLIIDIFCLLEKNESDSE